MNSRPGYEWIMANAAEYDSDECLLWPFPPVQCGYGKFMIDKKQPYAHRWICEYKNGHPPTPEHHAAHSCGNKLCVNWRHLSWKTNSENQFDRHLHEVGAWKGKLNPEKAAEIRRLRGTESRLSLASRFGVNEATIRQVQYGKIWKTGIVSPAHSEGGK
jgi:hypothetical protein